MSTLERWTEGSLGALTFGLTTYGGKSAAQSGINTIRSGKEFTFNSPWGKVRVAPLGNNTTDKYGKWPHYHRARLDSNGVPKKSQGANRHRPAEKKSHDKSFWDRF